MNPKEIKFLKTLDDHYYKGIISKKDYEENKTRQFLLKKHSEWLSSKNEIKGSEHTLKSIFGDEWEEFLKSF